MSSKLYNKPINFPQWSKDILLSHLDEYFGGAKEYRLDKPSWANEGQYTVWAINYDVMKPSIVFVYHSREDCLEDILINGKSFEYPDED